VKIFGESVGGWAVFNLLASPAASGLFRVFMVLSSLTIQKISLTLVFKTVMAGANAAE
jgi:carboxylesterase type B